MKPMEKAHFVVGIFLQKYITAHYITVIKNKHTILILFYKYDIDSIIITHSN